MRFSLLFIFTFCSPFYRLWCINPNDSIPPKHHKIIIFPLVLKSIETDWSFGAASSVTFRMKSVDTTVRTSNFQAIGLYSIRNQFVSAINGAIYFPGERYILNQQISYSYFPDKFWGLGRSTTDDQEENYVFRQFYFYPHFQRQISRNFYIGVTYEFQKILGVSYKEGGLFDAQDIPGRSKYKVSGFGMSLTYDSRNHAFVPNNGTLAQIIATDFSTTFGSDFSYTNLVLDTRKYISVIKNHVLALQGYGFFSLGGQIPLRSMSSLGGSNSMRGYYSGRFRDKNQIVFQAEYRAPIKGRFGVVAFGSYGDVGSRMNDFDFSKFKYSYGAGLRIALNKKERLNIRLDYGIGQGNSRGFYFQVGEAF